MRLTILTAILFIGHSSNAQSLLAEESFQMDGIDQIDLRGSFCDVKVTSSGSRTTYFEGEIRGSSGKNYSINYDKDGSSLRIWINSPSGNSWGFTGCDLELRMPSEASLDLDNSSGDVFVSGIAGREMKLKSSSGDIEARDIGNDLRLESSSGDIELDGLSGNLSSRSSSGDQEIRNVRGNVEGRSSSGEITYIDVVGDIEAETSSGGIELEGIEGSLKLESTSGSIDGEGIKLTDKSSFRSSSGSISMELQNELRDLNFDLKASSGSLRVGDKRADDRLIDRRNDNGIEITGVSTSGSQRYTN